MAKKIDHKGREGYRKLLFSLCPPRSLWFSEAHFRKIKKTGSLVSRFAVINTYK
jgi:hypothetical protein